MSNSTESLPEDLLAIEYHRYHGGITARFTWAENHFWTAFALVDVGLLFLFHGILPLFAFCILSLTLLVLVLVAFRLLLVLISTVRNPQIVVTREQIDSLPPESLPVYTILVPLYKEANVASGIVASLGNLEYPRDKLDIKLLLEGDDRVTIDAIERITLPPEFETVLVPPGTPRTKPKACNYGLACARGEFVVVFDAEDRPEADQLLKAVVAFRAHDEKVACIQAKLNYYNPRENFLTKCFALEYTTWFDMILPGIQYLDGPIPLGGTSNHFRTTSLQSFRGWDPYNVTEDCDLGVRLALSGYQTKLLDSTTWEEANTRLGNWIRQRSRWVKGYLQTHLVHTRRSFNLLRSLGIRKTILFYLCVSTVPIQQLLNLVCWPIAFLYCVLLTIDWFHGTDTMTVVAGSRDEYRFAWKMLYLDAGEHPVWATFSVIGFVGTILLVFANLLFILINLIACRLRGYNDLWPTALLSPVYWTLASIAAWKGAIQLISRPHYWEKTVHGLSSIQANIPCTAEGNVP
jgi:glycosyltransferase XagB